MVFSFQQQQTNFVPSLGKRTSLRNHFFILWCTIASHSWNEMTMDLNDWTPLQLLGGDQPLPQNCFFLLIISNAV